MAKIQIVFYSMFGHVHKLAEAVAEGARQVPGTGVTLYQVPELVPDEALEKSGAKAAREAFADIPVAKPENLAEADAIIFGTPTRFGNMCAQMRKVGVPYAEQKLLNMEEITGGTPYGATTMAGADGSRQPSENELAIARFQGKHVAEITQKLCG